MDRVVYEEYKDENCFPPFVFYDAGTVGASCMIWRVAGMVCYKVWIGKDINSNSNRQF